MTWPDGRETTGIDTHIEDRKAIFVFAPQPMPTPEGGSIAPTGESFRLMMTTVARWEGSTMAHEWLFWDNHAFMQQIGLAQ